ncbi:MAG TPA: RES family NAD+ phosphorylase [Jatrophihabitantaceae bacterium]
MVKLPLPPAPEALTWEDSDLSALAEHSVLWRLHRCAGENVVPWNELRFWGPSHARFDPQEPPPGPSERGVSYAALDVATCLAEVFQDRRVVDTSRGAPYLTAWRPTRALHLLDLTGTWPIRNGASHLLNSGPHDLCRGWARAIYTRWPDLDGLWHISAMTGQPEVTLYTAARDTFPARPLFSRPLDDPGTRGWIAAAAEQINYEVI